MSIHPFNSFLSASSSEDTGSNRENKELLQALNDNMYNLNENILNLISRLDAEPWALKQ